MKSFLIAASLLAFCSLLTLHRGALTSMAITKAREEGIIATPHSGRHRLTLSRIGIRHQRTFIERLEGEAVAYREETIDD
jgi:hypothetical protein